MKAGSYASIIAGKAASILLPWSTFVRVQSKHVKQMKCCYPAIKTTGDHASSGLGPRVQ